MNGEYIYGFLGCNWSVLLEISVVFGFDVVGVFVQVGSRLHLTGTSRG